MAGLAMRVCHAMCHRDSVTGELWCPVVGWTEDCPKTEEYENNDKEGDKGNG